MSTAASAELESLTVHDHLRAAVAQGVVAGVFVLNEYVLRKDLGGTRWHVLALLLVPALCQFSAMIWNPASARGLLAHRPFLVLGIPARLLLLVPLFVVAARTPAAFVVVLATAMAVEVLLIPSQNAVLAASYPASRRGRWFGRATAVQALTIAAVSLPAGWALDHFGGSWPWLYSVAALVGAWGYLRWAKMRKRGAREDAPRAPRGAAWRALRENPTFRWFEVWFMVYGTGFLMLLPVLPLYLVDELEVSYSQVGLARGLIFWLAMMVAGPFFGRLSDRIGILRTCSVAWLLLSTFPVVLLLVPGLVGLDVGFAVFGLAMAGVHVAWNLGPIVLARDADPLPYLDAHLSLVGVRALVGMVGGAWLQATLGSRAVFVVVIALELTAAAGMYVTARRSGRLWRWRVGQTARDTSA